MFKISGLGLLLMLAFSVTGFAQRKLFGIVIKKATTEVLPGVNVANLSRQKYNTSDVGGDYQIPAVAGDTLVFSSAGYLPDTVIVTVPMFYDSYQVFLSPNVKALPTVKIGEESNYQLDSIQRRNDYRSILDKKHPVVLMNEKRPGDDPGFSFSPFGYFSKTEKEKRRLKKRLKEEEEEDYIDYRFSPARVSQITRLPGDSLQIFLSRYRPSYHFCRIANNQDMLFYINEKLIVFRKQPDPLQ